MIRFTCFHNSASAIPRKIRDAAISPPSLHYESATLSHHVSDKIFSFEGYRQNPDFNYYISGSDVYPNVLMGLNKTYTLDSELWKKIEPTPKEFRELIRNMQTKALHIRQHPHGFAILDGKGTQIGVWYSILRAKTAIQMKDDRKVTVFTPDIDTYGDATGW
jgi:hypothetical protein